MTECQNRELFVGARPISSNDRETHRTCNVKTALGRRRHRPTNFGILSFRRAGRLESARLLGVARKQVFVGGGFRSRSQGLPWGERTCAGKFTKFESAPNTFLGCANDPRASFGSHVIRRIDEMTKVMADHGPLVLSRVGPRKSRVTSIRSDVRPD